MASLLSGYYSACQRCPAVLPSGKNNVQSLHPPIHADRTKEENAELVHAKAAGIVGLSGKVDPKKDYAYAFTARLAERA
jgi:hypothetical protein